MTTIKNLKEGDWVLYKENNGFSRVDVARVNHIMTTDANDYDARNDYAELTIYTGSCGEALRPRRDMASDKDGFVVIDKSEALERMVASITKLEEDIISVKHTLESRQKNLVESRALLKSLQEENND